MVLLKISKKPAFSLSGFKKTENVDQLVIQGEQEPAWIHWKEKDRPLLFSIRKIYKGQEKERKIKDPLLYIRKKSYTASKTREEKETDSIEVGYPNPISTTILYGPTIRFAYDPVPFALVLGAP